MEHALAPFLSAAAAVIGLITKLIERTPASTAGAPLVIVHDDSPREQWKAIPRAVAVHVTVDRAPALNVRFGVEVDGVKAPYFTASTSYREGRSERILRPGDRLPSEGTVSVEIPWWMQRRSAYSFHRRLVWARYRDERGRTWETINPADEAGHLSGPRRVRAVYLREYEENLRRTEMRLAAKRTRG